MKKKHFKHTLRSRTLTSVVVACGCIGTFPLLFRIATLTTHVVVVTLVVVVVERKRIWAVVFCSRRRRRRCGSGVIT